MTDIASHPIEIRMRDVVVELLPGLMADVYQDDIFATPLLLDSPSPLVPSPTLLPPAATRNVEDGIVGGGDGCREDIGGGGKGGGGGGGEISC